MLLLNSFVFYKRDDDRKQCVRAPTLTFYKIDHLIFLFSNYIDYEQD